MNRKRIFVLIVAIAVLAGLFLFKWRYLSPKDLIQNKLPGFFPKELISENVQVEALDDVTKLASENHRAVVTYKSGLNVEQNMVFFTQYLRDNDFKAQVKDLEDSVMILSTKEKTTLSVTIWKRSPVQVTILYILSK